MCVCVICISLSPGLAITAGGRADTVRMWDVRTEQIQEEWNLRHLYNTIGSIHNIHNNTHSGEHHQNFSNNNNNNNIAYHPRGPRYSNYIPTPYSGGGGVSLSSLSSNGGGGNGGILNGGLGSSYLYNNSSSLYNNSYNNSIISSSSSSLNAFHPALRVNLLLDSQYLPAPTLYQSGAGSELENKRNTEREGEREGEVIKGNPRKSDVLSILQVD